MGRPKPPDPMQVAQQQQGFNREAQADAVHAWSAQPSHTVGNDQLQRESPVPLTARRPSRSTLQDQARLEQERSIKSTTARA